MTETSWGQARSLRSAGLLTAGVAALVVAVFARWGPDWPAQEFRAWIAVHDGLGTWTTRWYSGTSLPGYSVLFPVITRVVGLAAVAAGSLVLATWAAMAFAPRGRVRHALFGVAIALTLTQSLVIGQVTFLLGASFGALALRLLHHGRHRGWVALTSLAAALASPLAGAVLLLAVPTLAATAGWRRAAALGGAVVGIGVCGVLGGSQGTFPFPWQSFVSTVAFCVTLWCTATSPKYRPLRRFALLYLLAAIAAFLIPTALGGNLTRLGKIIAVPLAVHLLDFSRGYTRRIFGVLALAAAAIWPSIPFTTSVVHGAQDPTRQPAYYAGLLGYLHTQDPRNGRLEIPFTRGHWETLWVAIQFPIARGWERQTDLAQNAVLYGNLSAAQYRTWLSDNAVSLIALPRETIDYGGVAEARLLAHPPGYLVKVWSDPNWTVWRVRGAVPLVAGPARVTSLSATSVQLSFASAGQAVLRIHAGPMWFVSEGSACLVDSSDGWLHVQAAGPGTVVLHANVGTQMITGDGC